MCFVKHFRTFPDKLLTQVTSTPSPGGLFISTGTLPVSSSKSTTP